MMSMGMEGVENTQEGLVGSFFFTFRLYTKSCGARKMGVRAPPRQTMHGPCFRLEHGPMS